MAFLPVARINLDLLDDEIERVKKLLGPEVVRIKHVFQEDTSGEPAVYFRIIITDLSSRRETLGDVADKIERTLRDEIRPYNWGIRLYTNFRNESEQAKLNDAWA